MSSSLTGKPNPFQKSNPFQVQQSYQHVSSSSFSSIQCKLPYRSFQPAIESLNQKQNSFSKPFKQQNQIWKFHEDNCGKVNVFNLQSYSRINSQKNSFEKQLTLNNGKKKPNQPGIEESNVDRFQKVSNPFARKYLLGGGKLVQSQVYNGQQNIGQYEKYRHDYENYTSINNLPENQNYRYNNYMTPQVYTANQPLVSVPTSVNNLQTSLHNKYDNQYGSRKSIEKEDHYRPGSFNNIPNPIVQSRFSIDKEKHYNYQYGSNHNVHLPPHPSQKQISYSRAQKDDGMKFSMKKIQRENQQRVHFGDSDQQKDHSRYQERRSENPPKFGSLRQVPQLQGPNSIIVHGITFYKQNIKSY